MYCPKCGAKIPGGAAFCASCGSPVGQLAPQPAQQTVQQPVSRPAQPVQPAPAGGSKTKLIIAVVVIAVIIVVVIAAVLLMGGGGSVAGPTNSIICDIRASGTYNYQSFSMTGTMKIEDPRKMSAIISGTESGTPVSMEYRFNGDIVYTKNPMIGTNWVKMDVSEVSQQAMLDSSWAQIEGKTPDQLASQIRSSMTSNMGITPDISCRYVADIPDSEFTLPPGETATDISSAGV